MSLGPFSKTLGPLTASIGAIDVSTEGSGLDTHTGVAQSSSSLSDLSLTLQTPDGVVTASIGQLASQCSSTDRGSTAVTTINDASIGSLSGSFQPPPNTTFQVPGLGSVVLNEQTATNVPGQLTSVTVNAVHLHMSVAGINADLVVGQSSCQASGPDVLAIPPAPASPVTPLAATPPAPPVVAAPRFAG